MTFYDQMDPVERDFMLRKAVAFSLLLENMGEAVDLILPESEYSNSAVPVSNQPPLSSQTKP